MTTKRITKRQADYFRGNVPGILAMLYNNIVGHVGYDISEDEIIEAFVPERDKDFVRNRSKDAYSHLNRSYYMRDAEIEVRGAGTPTGRSSHTMIPWGTPNPLIEMGSSSISKPIGMNSR
mgnify:CR=1 FL=1